MRSGQAESLCRMASINRLILRLRPTLKLIVVPICHCHLLCKSSISHHLTSTCWHAAYLLKWHDNMVTINLWR